MARNGKYLAVAERRGCKDFISIFNCSSWFSMSHFGPATEDLDGISWSPTRDILCIWESCFVYKVGGCCYDDYDDGDNKFN